MSFRSLVSLVFFSLIIIAIQGCDSDHDHHNTSDQSEHNHDHANHDGHDHEGHDHANHTKQKEKITYRSKTAHGYGSQYTAAYVCPMHCMNSGSTEPGKCPKCGMDYEKFSDHVKDKHHHRE